MGRARLGWTGGLGRRTLALIVAMLASATLFAGGQAVAAARPGGAGAARAAGQAAGTISTVAGGVGGPASGTKVALSPCDVAFADGHLLIADVADTTTRAGAVREMSPGSSLLTTLAGTHAFGPLGDGGAATAASLNSCGVTADSSGNLVIASGSNIRVVAKHTGTFYGQAMTAGDIYTVAGDGVEGFSGDGGPAASAELHNPVAVATNAAGNLVIADGKNGRIRMVTR